MLERGARQHSAGLMVRYDRASDHNNLCGVLLTMGLVHKDVAENARAAGNSAKAAEESRLQALALDAAMKEVKVALEQCDPNFVGAWQTRADILVAQNKLDEARAAYQLALDKMDSKNPGKQLIQLKLDAIGGAPAKAAA